MAILDPHHNPVRHHDNGNGRLRVPLPWLQFFLGVFTLLGGLIVAWNDLRVRQEFHYLDQLKAENEWKTSDRWQNARIRELELALARAGLDIQEPTIGNRRPKNGDEDDE